MTTTYPESSAPFRLRHDLRPGDLGRIVGLHGRVYAREHGLGAAFEADVAAALAEFVLSRGDGDRLWLAERGRLAGCLAVIALSPRDAQLRWFLLDPSARGSGLGERLLAEAVAFCRRRDFEHVFLWSAAGEASASLFRSAGFQKAEQRTSRRWGAELTEDRYVLCRPRPTGGESARRHP